MTARTDLYAWGLIFLECLTGKRVVEGASLQDLVFKQLGPEPVPLPAWLEGHRLGRLLRRVTEKNPQARDVTAQGLLLELEACVDARVALGGDRRCPAQALAALVALRPRGSAGSSPPSAAA